MAFAGTRAGRYSLRQNNEINVTPFVDVMLVLLIIFMVAAPLSTVAIKIDQPLATKEPPPLRPPTYVSISEDGAIFVSQGRSGLKSTDLSNLSRDVAASLGVAEPTAERVMVRAGRRVRYGRFMTVINALKKAGYDKIGLINENLE
jgi:biopolymer transport protein ExbD